MNNLPEMNIQENRKSFLWLVMAGLSVIFLLVTIPMLTLSGGRDILVQLLHYSGSAFDVETLDQAILGTLDMAMLKPLWEELWIGIMGIYCAVILKKMKKNAWWLSFFWGIMMLTNATIQGIYEVVVLHWSTACMQTYLFLFLGSIAVLSLSIGRKKYFSILGKE